MDQVAQTMSFAPAQAAKLRGQAGGSLIHGKFDRLALNFLKARQYQHEESTSEPDHQLRELQLLARLVQHAQLDAFPLLDDLRCQSLCIQTRALSKARPFVDGPYLMGIERLLVKQGMDSGMATA